jgi:hypothetical protein
MNINASPPVGGSGYEKPQSGLRPLCGFSPPHFGPPIKQCVALLYRRAKMSYTAGTLCAICFEICLNFIIKNIQKKKDKKSLGHYS